MPLDDIQGNPGSFEPMPFLTGCSRKTPLEQENTPLRIC
jgi:hypothetical protein